MNSAPSHPGRHMLDGVVRVFLAEALIIPTSIVTVAFLTRQLGPGGYGLLTLAALLVGWIEWVLAAFFGRATIRLVSQAEDWRTVGSGVVRLQLMVSGAMALLLWLLAGPISSLLNEPVLAAYLRLFCLDIPLFALAITHRHILVGMGRFRQRAMASVGRWITRMVLIVFLVELGLGIQGAILGSIGASLVELVIARSYVRPPFLRDVSFPGRQFWSYATPLFLLAISLRLYDKLDLFLFKYLGATAAEAGIYGAAQNISLASGVFALSLSPILLSTLLSTLTQTLRTGNSSLAEELGRNSMRVAIMVLPFAGMAAGAAPEIVRLLFGPQILGAAPLLALLIFGALGILMVSVTTAVLTAAGRPGLTFAVSGPLVPVAVAGYLFLIPRLGALGAALVTTGAAVVAAATTTFTAYRVCRIAPPAGSLCRSLLLCGMAYVLAAFWPTPGFLLLLKLGVVGVAILLLFLLLGELSAAEISWARGVIRGQTVTQENPGDRSDI